MVDMRPAHINKLYQPEVEVVGDIADALVQIGRRTSRRQEPDRALEIKRMMVKEHESYASDDSFPMKPQRILNDVRRVMGRGGHRNLRCRCPQDVDCPSLQLLRAEYLYYFQWFRDYGNFRAWRDWGKAGISGEKNSGCVRGRRIHDELPGI